MNLLEQALDVLERDGWTQGLYQNGEGERCMMGALDSAGQVCWTEARQAILGGAAKPEMTEYWLAHQALIEEVAEATGMSVPQFNDAPGRTFDEVSDMMRMAAKRLANGEVPA